MKLRGVALFLLVILLLSGCRSQETSGVSASAGGIPWPTKDWQTSKPEKQGMNSAVLDEMQAVIEKEDINLHSLLIIRHGVIVSETYYHPYQQDTQHQMFSVTKSFIGTLVGMAVDQGKLKLDDPVADIVGGEALENLDEQKQTMTVRDLLTMTSGLDWQEGDPTYMKMYRSSDWVKMVMDLPMVHQPGEEFRYCSGCSHVLSGIVQRTSGMDTESFARQYLLAPLGIKNYEWEKDSQGIALGGWGLNITPRDMGKLGYLYLHNGQWEGKQILSTDWVKASTTKQIDADGRLDYGYQWWIYDTHGAYAALGRDGQTIWVSPELDLIVVTTAQIDGHDPIWRLIDDYVIKAVNE